VDINLVGSAGPVSGLSGPGIMSGLASYDALVGGGAVAGMMVHMRMNRRVAARLLGPPPKHPVEAHPVEWPAVPQPQPDGRRVRETVVAARPQAAMARVVAAW
jgi:hypothetical protein